MSDSVRPQRRQPTRLPRPWDSPGKNTGVGCHFLLQCMQVKSESEVAQSCLTLSDPMDCSLPGSSVHGSFQARVLEWGAIAFSECLCMCVCVCVCVRERERELLSNVWLFVTPWTVAHQAPFSEGFSRQEYWSGLPFPSSKRLMKVCKIKMVTVLSSTVTRKHLWDLRKYYLLRSSCFGLS